MLKKVDIHTHILPADLPADCGMRLRHHADGKNADMLNDNGTSFRTVQCNCWNASTRIRDCDLQDVSVQVLSTVPVLFNYQKPPADGSRIAKALNDHMAGVVRANPQRFAGLGTLPMQDVDLACQELRRCKQDLRLDGVQIGTHVNDLELGHRSFEPLYALAEELGAAIFIHPWDMSKAPHQQSYWKPWLIGMPHETANAYYSLCASGVLERHPALRVAFAHGGGSFPFLLGRMDHGYAARPDLCAIDNATPPSRYAEKVWVDSHVCDARSLKYLLDCVGPEKIALGSDYPFPLGELEPGRLTLEAKFEAQVTRKILVDNALKWLGRTAESFAA